MADRSSTAAKFVESIDLTGIPRRVVAQDATAEASEVFTTAKAQAQVVGSGLFSFAEGVTADTREAISNSALLAQLVANKQALAEQEPLEWYAAYRDVLQNIGWVIQDQDWADYTAEGTAGEVHQQVIEVLEVALGPAATALNIVRSAMDMLKAMAPGNSWLTIFNRESQHARIARFQVGLVEKGEAADVFVLMLACLIEARASVTQVLVFKFRTEHASFKASTAKVSIDSASLQQLLPAIRSKVRAYQLDYVSSIKNL